MRIGRTVAIFLLFGLSPRHQQMFAQTGCMGLILGRPAAGVALSFVQADYEGATRHAVNRFARKGYSHLCLLMPLGGTDSNEIYNEFFLDACAAWHAQIRQFETLTVPLGPGAPRLLLCTEFPTAFRETAESWYSAGSTLAHL